ncbi:hypothetical protein F511_43439 [Dorcoceras hygrometricum]|uniref:Uncharacterized protein n=1 Tax=Dorcoceras hygrometricum TaxID=472368 RepID=A0A2Z7AVQ3_9LAMI|nr:hypothetical protein F511_43439 [Dorcoceras hygrometricum]
MSIPAFVFDDFCGTGFLVSCSVDCYSLELLFTERFFPRFLSIPAFVFDDFGGTGFLVSCSVDCYSLEVVERLVEVSVKLLVYEDFWRNLIERSLIVVRFWISDSLPI